MKQCIIGFDLVSRRHFLFVLLVSLVLIGVSGCGAASSNSTQPDATTTQEEAAAAKDENNKPSEEDVATESEEKTGEEDNATSSETQSAADGQDQPEKKFSFHFSQVPAYSGQPVVVINNNVPFFTADDLTTTAFEKYSDLDSLGRCGAAYANICKELMPTEPRGTIGAVRPSGWHTVKYNGVVEGNYLYNRCHLIAFELAGENANTKNLITGTRYMNTEGMLPYENDTAAYVKRTGHHVLYRVTPIFEGENLVASGVLIEARSVEDDNFHFCVYCYNVQPGVTIDYSNGESALSSSQSGSPQHWKFQ